MARGSLRGSTGVYTGKSGFELGGVAEYSGLPVSCSC